MHTAPSESHVCGSEQADRPQSARVTRSADGDEPLCPRSCTRTPTVECSAGPRHQGMAVSLLTLNPGVRRHSCPPSRGSPQEPPCDHGPCEREGQGVDRVGHRARGHRRRPHRTSSPSSIAPSTFRERRYGVHLDSQRRVRSPLLLHIPARVRLRADGRAGGLTRRRHRDGHREGASKRSPVLPASGA